MELHDSLADCVGATPLVRLRRMTAGIACTVVVKAEFLNPGGSVKDRAALAMLEAAEAVGQLHPGSVIVEPTSGNTGVGLAQAAALKGYRCVFTISAKMAPEKVALLRAYGAEVVVCPMVARDHPDSFASTAARLVDEIPGAFMPNQYVNPANPGAHEEGTGPEIWRQTSGRITHFVAGIGTGGTISGVGRALKRRNPGVVVVGADPVGSVFAGGTAGPYLVEGTGEDFWPETFDRSVVDRYEVVTDGDAFHTARRLAREEGMLVGGSAGLAVCAALRVGETLGPEHLVVVLAPDSGRNYLTRIFDDGWMTDRGLLEPD